MIFPQIVLDLEADGLSFAPDAEDIKHELRQLVTTFREAVCGVDPVASHPDFEVINRWAGVAPVSEEESSQAALEAMLKEDETLLSSLEILLSNVDFGFAVAGAYRV